MTLEQYFCQRHKLMWKKFWRVFLCYLIKRFFADLPDIQMGIVNQYMCVIFFVGMKQAVKDDCQIMIAEVWNFLQHLFILFVIDQTHSHEFFCF